MRDERLRELERVFRESGTLEDEVAWIGARFRAGEIEEEKLRLAAYCGSALAANVLKVDSPKNRPRWARGFARFGQEAATKVLIAASRIVLEQLTTWSPLAENYEAVLLATEDWLECPCGEHADDVDRLAEVYQNAVQEYERLGQIEWDLLDGSEEYRLDSHPETRFVEAVRGVDPRKWLNRGIGYAKEALDERGQSSKKEREKELRGAVVDEVGAWAASEW